jgi:hypothetical protein
MSMRSGRFSRATLFVSIVCVAHAPTSAQTLAGLQGRVVDASGAVLPGALISVQDVDLGRRLVRDFHLAVGQTTESVVVRAEVSLVDRATTAVGHVVTAETVQEIPLNGRHFIDVVGDQVLLQQAIGIGLTIARSIVDAHRGNLQAHNNHDGGATFTVPLPRSHTREYAKPADSP